MISAPKQVCRAGLPGKAFPQAMGWHIAAWSDVATRPYGDAQCCVLCADPLVMDNGMDLIDMISSCYESPEDTGEEAVQYNFSQSCKPLPTPFCSSFFPLQRMGSVCLAGVLHQPWGTLLKGARLCRHVQGGCAAKGAHLCQHCCLQVCTPPDPAFQPCVLRAPSDCLLLFILQSKVCTWHES